jgi:hypothetical protein
MDKTKSIDKVGMVGTNRKDEDALPPVVSILALQVQEVLLLPVQYRYCYCYRCCSESRRLAIVIVQVQLSYVL